MPQSGTQKCVDSLFSLELVVDKLYMPYVQCRFPAIAFRLLDYPTIVIKHVDDELGKAIRSKISFDPYYQLPDQFIELKDRYGNFMISKGKSCLFRMSEDILRQHLANTPLYVMVIDLFPEVPKLVGNSSVPLNSLMDSICVDIAKVGPAIPSVHGDKGLFKLYNLMGKEVGYFVLGFRLLYLGSSLIPHLPESMVLQQQKSQKDRKNRCVDGMIQDHQHQAAEMEDSNGDGVELRNSACMTEPVKHDVLLQTVELQDKAVHVALQDFGIQANVGNVKKKLRDLSTQTEKNIHLKEAMNVKQKWAAFIEPEVDDIEEIIINNIVCPPPLFYNSNASPSIRIEKQLYHEAVIDDSLSDIQSYDGQGLEKVKTSIKEDSHQKKLFAPSSVPMSQARAGETILGLPVAPHAGTVFPLLTALLNELSLIQSPQLLLHVSNQIQAAPLNLQQASQSKLRIEKSPQTQKNDKLSPSAVEAVATALAKKFENPSDNANFDKPEKQSLPQNSQSSKAPKRNDQRIHHSQKQTSVHQPKKSKLIYGITNTQRLRLQKSNPQWLKTAEKEVSNLKGRAQTIKQEADINKPSSELYSDTLIEVRRLAEIELNNTGSGDTLINITPAGKPSSSTEHNENVAPGIKNRSAKGSTRKLEQVEKTIKSTGGKPLHQTHSLKSRISMRTQQNETLRGMPDSEEHQTKPVPQMRFVRKVTSSSHNNQELSAKENQVSPDLVSSSSHSVEVPLTSLDDSDESIPLPDDSLNDKRESPNINFPKYLSKDLSLLESIDGAANASLNMSDALDDNSPLESTRYSKNFTSDQNDGKVVESTDGDTRQFQSTDEPELQDLNSEEENPSAVGRSIVPTKDIHAFQIINPQLSENSPVPSVRKSTNKQDFTRQSYVPSFSQKLESSSSSRSLTNKSFVSAIVADNVETDHHPEKDISELHGHKKNNFSISDGNEMPQSTNSSPQRPTPQPRKPTPLSLHTDSLSSYMPSDPDNVIISLSSQSGNYSDDFLLHEIDDDRHLISSAEEPRKIIPSTKLGYTIH